MRSAHASPEELLSWYKYATPCGGCAEEYGQVDNAADTGDQHPVRPSPQRYRAEIIRDEAIPSSGGSHQAFLSGLAHLYIFISYQHRAQHAGQRGVEVEGGRGPTADWFLNLSILTSGGFR